MAIPEPADTLAAGVVRSGLRNALRMLQPAHMVRARDFVLAPPDPAVDLVCLSDQTPLLNAATLRLERACLDEAVARSLVMDILLVPSVNLGAHNCGVCVTETRFSSAVGDAKPGNASACGRYCKDETTGEMLFICYPPDFKGRPAVQLLWLGAPSGQERRVRDCVNVYCDPDLFNQGKLVESVYLSEVGSRVATDICTGECAFAGAPSLHAECPQHLTLVPPADQLDFSHVLHNVIVHSGSAVGVLSTAESAAPGSAIKDSSMKSSTTVLTITVGRDQDIITALLTFGIGAHMTSLRSPAVIESAEESADVALLTPPEYPSRFQEPESSASGSASGSSSPTASVSASLGSPGESFSMEETSSPLTPELSPAGDPTLDQSPSTAASLPKKSGKRDRRKSSIVKRERPKPLTREEAAYRRKMSNRASAARSNARRKASFENLKQELKEAQDLMEELQRKDNSLREENLRLRRRAKEERISLTAALVYTPPEAPTELVESDWLSLISSM